MRRVHARFAGERGTFAHFGDSITMAAAFWASLRLKHQNLSPEAERDYTFVSGYMQAKCWDQWKGPRFGNAIGMTIRWADENISTWLTTLNPEVALIMFGTNVPARASSGSSSLDCIVTWEVTRRSGWYLEGLWRGDTLGVSLLADRASGCPSRAARRRSRSGSRLPLMIGERGWVRAAVAAAPKPRRAVRSRR